MTSDLIKKIIIVVLIIFLLLGAIIGGNKIVNGIKKKKQIVDKINTIGTDVNTIKTNLYKESENYSNKYITDNANLEELLKDNNFKTLEEFANTNSNIIIQIDTNTYVKEFPQTIEEMSNTIIALQNTINKMNEIRKEDKVYITKIITNTIVKIETVQTNLESLKKDIVTYVNPKLFSYGIGVGFSFNGYTRGEVLYDVSAHGTLYIYDTWYVGLEAGMSYNLSYNPKIGLFLGIKF